MSSKKTIIGIAVATKTLVIQAGCQGLLSRSELDSQLKDVMLLSVTDRQVATMILEPYDEMDCLVSISDYGHGTGRCLRIRLISGDNESVECWEYVWPIEPISKEAPAPKLHYQVHEPHAAAMFRRLYAQASRGNAYLVIEHQPPREDPKHCLLTTGTMRGLTMPVGSDWLADFAYAVIALQVEEEAAHEMRRHGDMFIRVGPQHVASVNDYIISAVRFYDDACLLYNEPPEAVSP